MAKIDIETVNRLWRSNATVAEIAAQLACAEISLYRVVRRERRRDGEAKWPYRRNYARNGPCKDKAAEPDSPPPETLVPVQEILRLHKKGLGPIQIGALLKVRYADIQAVIDGRAGQ